VTHLPAVEAMVPWLPQLGVAGDNMINLLQMNIAQFRIIKAESCGPRLQHGVLDLSPVTRPLDSKTHHLRILEAAVICLLPTAA